MKRNKNRKNLKYSGTQAWLTCLPPGRRRQVLRYFLVIPILYLSGMGVFAQDGVQYIYIDHISNDYLDYLVNSGQMIPEFIFHQPYDETVWNKADVNSKPYTYFTRYWQKFYNQTAISGQLQISDDIHYHDAVYNRYRVNGSAHLVTGLVTFANRTGINQDYKYDPFYAGDLSESKHWLYGRVNDAYMDLHTGGFEFFIGRMNRNWGPPGSPGLILSNNPYSYDHLLFSYTYKKVKLSVLAARLNNLIAYVQSDPGKPESIVLDAQRYLVGHRLDISLFSNLQLAFTEMATFGGIDQEFDWAFLNPMTFYYGLQRNDKKQLNGFWNTDLFYKPFPKLSIYAQFLIDDIIVNNDPGVDDRARYPDRLGVLFSLRSGDLFLDGLNINVTYDRIWNRTYQSQRTFENYHYRELGLGYPCASCEEVKLNLAYWDWFPWYFKNETILGRYGEVDITDLFPGKKEKFPVSPVTRNLINRLEVHYFLSPELDIYSKIKYSADKKHYLNRMDQLRGLSFLLGVQVTLTAGMDL